MTHEEQRDLRFQKEGFDPLDTLDIKVIGGLIQQQQIRATGQSPGQQDPPFHPTRKRGELCLSVQTHAFE